DSHCGGSGSLVFRYGPRQAGDYVSAHWRKRTEDDRRVARHLGRGEGVLLQGAGGSCTHRAPARGGAKSYLSNGKMTVGFAVVAFPAESRQSGVKTFIVNQDGTVYKRDLGSMTTEIAAAMKD